MRSAVVKLLLVSTFLCAGASCPLAADEVSIVEALEERLVAVKEKVAPAVVSISAVGGQVTGGNIYEDPFAPYKRRFFGEHSAPEQRRNVGSGVIIDERGYVLTNHHVIAETQQVFVTLSSGKTYPGRVLGFDPSVDLAVIKIDADRKLTALKWVEPDRIRPGRFAIAFGNPWGLAADPQPTVTLGIISAVNRSIKIGEAGKEFTGLIQTDAAINPGNSGGPLVDIEGRILGINTAIFSTTGGYQGIGFAVPITPQVEKIIEKLKSGEQVRRPYVGLAVSVLDQAKARLLRFESGRGLLVEKVDPEGPAAKAGVNVGDIILTVDEKAIETPAALKDMVDKAGVGATVNVELFRDRKRLKAAIVIGHREQALFAETSPRFWRGLSVQTLPDSAKEREGVLVDGVLLDSPAWRAGIRQGDVISKVNDVNVTSPAAFRDAVKGSENQDALLQTSRGIRIVKRE